MALAVECVLFLRWCALCDALTRRWHEFELGPFENMKAEYYFSKGKRGALIPTKGKTRITIYIDDAVLDEFRVRAERVGTGYQTMMNEALKAFVEKNEKTITATVLRQIIREEILGISQRRSAGRTKVTRSRRDVLGLLTMKDRR